ncbi:MAG: hypothetical protein IT547_14595 [Hyphomonadaceae bacterium]|nr:hypothetical protein [Hyphomonadaceae bacterium]
MKCPTLLPTVVISDDAELAAMLTCALARPGAYLPVIDGPRMTRDDSQAEVTRRNNAVARARAKEVYYAGLGADAEAALDRYLQRVGPRRINDGEAVKGLAAEKGRALETLQWSRHSIGLGLLTALRAGKMIAFADEPSPAVQVRGKSDHLVVCEAGEPLSEVIAANYAFALGAGLCVIPERSKHDGRAILEAFYGLYDDRDVSPTERLQELARTIRAMCGDIVLPEKGSLTFITGDIPYGFALPELPSTHLFKYPDLGLAIINGFSNEQPSVRGTNVAVLIDPQQTDAPEIDAAARLLAQRGMFVRAHRGGGATVDEVSRMIELYPYDLLVLATHCGDADGYRWTYEFTDSDGRIRKLVVDIALGIGDPRKSEDDKLEVMQFMRFHELDGVLWDDPDRLEKVDAGRALDDFMEWTRTDKLEPVLKELIPRVADSAALKMFDHNYLALPRSLANKNYPIIINNACASWRELAGRFTFSNARAYVGTLFPIATTEARDVVIGALEKHGDKALAHAFWSAQNGVYRDGIRRPYIVTGVYPQRIRIIQENTPLRILGEMQRALAEWQRVLESDRQAGREERGIERIVTFYDREVRSFGANRIKLPDRDGA